MTEVVYLKRNATDVPFGFKLQGGTDFATPLSVLQVTPGGIAHQSGLRDGDAILKINEHDTNWMEHSRAKQELIRSGNEIKLTVQRNAVDTTRVQCTPLSQLRSNPPQDLSSLPSPPPIPKTCLSIDKSEPIKIGVSHNRAPMPFNSGVGTTIDYKAAKPTNWQPGDYLKWSEAGNSQQQPQMYQQQQQQQQAQPHPQHMYQQQQAQPYQAQMFQQHQAPPPPPPPPPPSMSYQQQQPHMHHQVQSPHQQAYNQSHPQSPTVTAVFHNQYNTPLGIYSDSNVLQEFQNQTKSFIEPRMASAGVAGGNQFSDDQESSKTPVYLQELKKRHTVAENTKRLPRGCNSLSMAMLNKGLESVIGTDKQPPSVFDLKTGDNPTGATIPRGFRSVQPPVVPQEQRHAPMRKEYQIQHVKQSWIEPK